MNSTTYADYQQQLQIAEERLLELNEKGVQALSRYDIEIAAGGDAEQALQTATRLVGNHVRYFTEQLANTQQPLFAFWQGRQAVLPTRRALARGKESQQGRCRYPPEAAGRPCTPLARFRMRRGLQPLKSQGFPTVCKHPYSSLLFSPRFL